MYYVLTGDYEKLVNIPFDMITVRFSNEKEMSISKADIAKYVNSRNLIIAFCHIIINPANRDKSGICSFYLSAGCGVL